ncbi:LrgB family protein [uncultured Lamprocystis sp.]|jgi:predicted murein hydrolase (TIGR00659 family)|uniref:LrgB family protein n=1 Tax=uncultured Lamprocystis sp. TaxID=543132 RepID=UPI0025F1BC5D|nr:LrgB family protein [uncultured Lamprocystis sp.]
MTDAPLTQIWVYLAASPLLWLTATLVCYLIALKIYRLGRENALLNPVAIAVGLLIALLQLTGTPYQTYFDGAQFVHFLLGPATVALAIPLYRQRERLKTLALPILAALLAGVTTAALSAVALGALFGADTKTLISLAPKSVTAPVAMGISEKLGGLPSLTAVLVVSTGIVGAVLGTGLLRLLRIRDDAVKGFAMGLTSHGIGTARAFQVSPVMGAFSGLAMALSAFVTALLLPPLLRWIGLVGD